MDGTVIVSAFRLAFATGGMLLAAVVIGGVFAGMFRVATQIDDPAIGFAGRVAGLAVALFVGGPRLASELSQFAVQLWSGAF